MLRLPCVVTRVVSLGVFWAVLGVRPLWAQAQVPVKGHVVDAVSAKPIAGATVSVPGTRTATDGEGRFSLETPPGDVTITIEARGYLSESRRLALLPGAAQPVLEVVLFGAEQFTETVTVGGEAAPLAQLPPARVEVTPLQVNSVAGAVDNVFRVIQTLPGVSAADEIGSRLTVRGGSPDQNLTMMDGVEVHNPYRLFGLFSAFNPATVKSFELSAGGFGPKYGDRLSSLLTVENRPGTETARLAGSAAIALTDGNIVLEGKLPGTSTGSWLLTGRRTYYDLLIGKLLGQQLPSFADVQTILSWLPRPGQRVALTAIRSRENTDANFDDEDTSESFALLTGASNDLASVSFFTRAGERASSRTILSWYRNSEQIGVTGRFANEARRSNSRENTNFANIGFTRDLLLRDIALREEFSFAPSDRHGIEAGGDVHLLDTGWAWRITGDRNPSEANGSSIQGGSGLPAILNSTRLARRASLWLTDRWVATPRLTIQPGVRLDWNDVSRESVLAPRVSAAYDLGGGFRARAATGLYTQSPGYEKQLQGDYFVDLSDTSAVTLRSERAIHGIAGVEKDLGPSTMVRVEAYWKRFDRMIAGRLETESERTARLSTYAFPAEFASSVPTTPLITTVPENAASGRAYGFDVFVSKTATPGSRFTGWASYTWGKARWDAYGRNYPFDYDRRHAVSAVTSFRLSRLIEVALTARIASGFPYTPVRALRVAATESTVEGATRLVPERDPAGLLVYTTDLGGVENLNSARLPVFGRLDVRTTFSPKWQGGRWQLYIEIINATNRQNAGSFEPSLSYNPDGDTPRLTYTRDQGLPLLPTFGMRFRI